MNSLNIKINQTEKGEEVILLPQFGLGKITEETGTDEHGRKYISMAIGTQFTMTAMENAVFRNLDTAKLDRIQIVELQEEIRGYMQEYAKSFILNTLGVDNTPIMRDKDGKLVGFNKEYELNIVTE